MISPEKQAIINSHFNSQFLLFTVVVTHALKTVKAAQAVDCSQKLVFSS